MIKRLTFAVFCSFAFCVSTFSLNAQQFTDETATRFPEPNLSEYTNQVTIGDIDQDGDLDLVLANGQGFFGMGAILPQRIYVNDGTGVFTDESNTRLNFFGWARGVELGDIDGDGDLDLIYCQDYNMLPHLFENDGNGFFTDVTLTNLPNDTLSCTRAQFADLDNDGDLDLYLNNGGTNRFGCGQNRIYINDGSGIFSDQTNVLHPLENVCEPMDVSLGDIDGDFDIDIRTGSTGTNQSRLLANDGTGLMTYVTGLPADSTCYSYDFGDIDGDGDLDMIGVNAANGSSRELLLENDGAGGFTNITNQISPNPNLDDNDSKFFDYDNDGDLDLIVARIGTGGERIYNNDGTGVFTQDTTAITNLPDSTLDVMVADLTGNGRLDIVTMQGESGSFVNRIYINNGPADTLPPRIIDTEEPENSVSQNGPIVIRAAILDDMTSDRNFFDGGISLRYSINGGADTVIPMKHSGGQIYRAEIPQQASGSVVNYAVTATDFAGNIQIGPSKSLEVAGTVVADDVQLLRGILIDGGSDQLLRSDDDHFVAQVGFTLNSTESPVWIDMTGTSPVSEPATFGFSIESSANTPNIRQAIELFNFDSGEFQVADTRLASFSVDEFATLEIDQNASDFVDPNSGQIMARVGWKQDGFILLFPWNVSIDRAVWTISE